MKTYKVNHNGSCRSEETGLIYNYTMNEPIELPEDVAEALGAQAKLVDNAPKEIEKEVKKEVKKAPKNKMIEGEEAVTK